LAFFTRALTARFTPPFLAPTFCASVLRLEDDAARFFEELRFLLDDFFAEDLRDADFLDDFLEDDFLELFLEEDLFLAAMSLSPCPKRVRFGNVGSVIELLGCSRGQ
jgi:hypothetical protein